MTSANQTPGGYKFASLVLVNKGERTSTSEREYRNTAGQGEERFMAKCIAAEKARAGLRHAVACPNVTGRTKEKIAQSKRARADSLAIVD